MGTDCFDLPSPRVLGASDAKGCHARKMKVGLLAFPNTDIPLGKGQTFIALMGDVQSS